MSQDRMKCYVMKLETGDGVRYAFIREAASPIIHLHVGRDPSSVGCRPGELVRWLRDLADRVESLGEA